MKEKLAFLSHVVGTEQYSQVHFCKDCIQCFNGYLTATIPYKNREQYSVDYRLYKQAVENSSENYKQKITSHNLILKNSQSRIQLPISFNYVQQHSGKGKKVKTGCLQYLKPLTKFSDGDADHLWAKSVIIRDGYAYTTNNIVVCRTKTTLHDCILPVSLLSCLFKIDLKIRHFIFTEQSLTVVFKNKWWIQTPIIAENIPDIAVVFNKFLPGSTLHTLDKKALKKAILLQTNEKICINKKVLSTDLYTVKGINIADCCLQTTFLNDILNMFEYFNFGKELSFFESKDREYQAIMAGMV